MTRIVILTGDPLGERMAGPAIRAWNMAHELERAGHELRIVTTGGAGDEAGPIPVAAVAAGDDARFRVHERWADVIVVQGYGVGQFPSLRTTDRYLVADLYDPMHLENLEQGRGQPAATWALRVEVARDAIVDQLARADFLLCANERQRMLYLGHLAALGRLTPTTYAHDPELRRLLDLAPFGLPAEPPAPLPARVIRGVVPGIDGRSKLLVWGGGMYDWFDPLTLIRATALLRERLPELRLFFMGTRHPKLQQAGIVREAVDLARELGVLDAEVVFNDGWVPYHERGAYLLEADAGVSTHRVHVETSFAFRTRILDYLWAGLPVVTTEGDSFADLVREYALGVVVPEGDPEALAEALETVLADAEAITVFRHNVALVREDFAWPIVLRSLLDYVAAPYHAADYVPGRAMGSVSSGRRTAGLGHDLRMAWHHLRAGGPSEVARRIRARRGGGA